MATQTPGTRTRMIDATIAALERHGVAGMSFTEVLRASGAARGAIYHHFPGGKRQLVCEAAEQYAQRVRENLAALPGETPAAVADAFFAAVRPVVAASAEGAGCAVAAVALDPDLDADLDADPGRLRGLAATAFGDWSEQLARRFTDAGLPEERALDLATTLITVLEGAHVLCRAAGNLEPFERAARTAASLAR
jgi:TetR/AcrR family transcriptional regulator, lmrAB and yxaGH operons repressor